MPAAPVTFVCVNCDGEVGDPKWPYLFCSDLCKQEAKAVRYWRAKIAANELDDPNVVEALQIKIAFVLSGGYPERERRLSDALRRAIFDRDGQRCRLCGGDATEIDHIAGDSNDPGNLQALCRQCHLEKTATGFRAGNEETKHKAALLRHRAEHPFALRESDDENAWRDVWRQHAEKRRKEMSRLQTK